MDQEHIAANLRRWRQLRGKSQAEMAAAVGVSRSTYRNMETSSAPTDITQIAALADALGVKVSDLLNAAAGLEGVRLRTWGVLKMREAILSSVAGRLEACAEIERALDQEGDREALESSGAWDALERGAGPNIDGAIERADAVRAALWLRDFEPIRNPLGAIERLGVTVLLEPVQSERFTGLSVKSSQRLAVVVGAWPRLSQERVAFSAAHELGHLLMHESFGDGGRVELAVEEEEANAFAAQLLLPARAFEREWSQRRGQALADRVLGIKALYGVSFRTVLYQMDRAGYADARRAWRLFADQYWRVHRATLDGELEANRARPEAFSTTLLSQEPAPMRGGVLAACYLGRLARAARLRGVASQSTCAQALGLSLAEFDTLEFCWAEEAGQLNLFAQVQP